MQTLVIDMDIPRIVLTQLLSRISPAALLCPLLSPAPVDSARPALPRPDWVRAQSPVRHLRQ
ncbi:hypothetical protein [Candidatus Amarolinea dominans]|uniref:hypothetical protein n=1 Tax=Candidatus Amarolinea dominans TaxID=3140696 RepID=UPI0031CC6AEA